MENIPPPEGALERVSALGAALITVGLVLALGSGLADVIGVGGEADFGWKQITGLAVGTGLLGAGIATAWAEFRSGGSSARERL
jgi:hypothetical protein